MFAFGWDCFGDEINKLQCERNSSKRTNLDRFGAYKTMMKLLVHRHKHHLSIVELLRNILQYLRDESERLKDTTKLLRFCAMYGLSGAIRDVLDGKYGPVGSVTIDTLLRFWEESRTLTTFELFGVMWMPAWAFGVALGYPHVIRQCINTLGAKIDMHLITKKENEEMIGRDSLPSLMLYWAIKTKFRWISHDLEEVFRLLFHINSLQPRDEDCVWRGRKYNPQQYWDDRDTQRRYKAKCCYNEKQMMLQTLIELGMPFELLIPKMNIEVEKKVLKVLEDTGLEESDEMAWQAMLKRLAESLTRLEIRAKFHIEDAAEEWGSFQERGSELSVVDFSNHVVGVWQKQSLVQESRSREFEKFDPRWTEFQENGQEAFLAWWGRKSRYYVPGYMKFDGEEEYSSEE